MTMAGGGVAAPTSQRWASIPTAFPQGEPNSAFVHIDRSVGAGLIVKGQIHHGPEWTAGEIGYLPVPGSSVQAVRNAN
jgi:predicted NBD/HSP70 family sugar kinase